MSIDGAGSECGKQLDQMPCEATGDMGMGMERLRGLGMELPPPLLLLPLPPLPFSLVWLGRGLPGGVPEEEGKDVRGFFGSL